jgi:alkylation response protein AidB-like acyl-CoA dehydrogenase
MHFELTERSRDFQQRVRAFVREHVLPIEHAHFAELEAARNGGDWRRWRVPERVERLKARAQADGLWNL